MAIAFQEELNAEQYEAVISRSPTNLILAGAGTGKTRTLTYRVAWLLSQGVAPENILLLTFTNKAAREMLQRVEALTGVESVLFYGGTFHHICQRLLRRHLEHPNFAILDEDDALALFNEAIRDVAPEFSKNKNNPTGRVLFEIVSYARNSMRSINYVIEERHPYMIDHAGVLNQFVDRYQAIKEEQNVFDYDDLLCRFVQILNDDPEIAMQYSHQFQHILVDEYQDTNPIQLKMVDLMARDEQLFAVGDDAQCIYTWRGADIRSITEFSKKYRQTKVTKIQTNYRSTPEILALANEIPVSEKFEYTKILRSTKASFHRPWLVSVLDARQQASFIIKRIKGLQGEGYSLSDIAVLYRAHYQSMELQIELSRNNIPYTITSGIRFFEQAHVKDILAFLRFVVNPNDARAFIRLLCRFPRVGEKTAERLLWTLHARAEATKKNIFELFDDAEAIAKIPPTALEFWWPLRRVLTGLYQGSTAFRPDDPPAPLPEDLFVYAAQKDEVKAPIVEPFENIGQMIDFILDGEYMDYLQKTYSNWQTRCDDLAGFSVFCNKFQDLSELIQQVTLLQSESNETGEEALPTLRLSTIHQAKGLEFGAVFVLNLNENSFPLKRSIEADDLGEERRLFYVAVTRAKRELYLCVPSQVVVDQKKTRFPIPLQQSRFLNEVSHKTYEVLEITRPRVWSGRPGSNR